MSYSGFSQGKWVDVQLSETVGLKMPRSYTRRDTLGQDNILATSTFGYMQAVRIPDPVSPINNEQDLQNYYKSFQDQSIEQSDGKLISDSAISIGDIVGRFFMFETYWNDTLEIQETVVVFIDHDLYSFTYAYFHKNQIAAGVDKDRFMSSIRLINADHEDQLTVPNESVRSGEAFGLVLRYFFLAGIALAGVLWFLKKYKPLRLIKNIFTWILWVWGGVCVFIYLGNVFFENNRYDLLLAGIICLIIGSVLRLIKVPGQPVL